MRLLSEAVAGPARLSGSRLVAAGLYGAGDATPIRQALHAMQEVTAAVAAAGQVVLIDFRALTGRCFAAEFELAAQATAWQIPEGCRVAVVDHDSHWRLWDRWSAIAAEQRRCVEVFSDPAEAAGWLRA